MIIATSALTLVLSACTSIPDDQFSIVTISEDVEQPTKDIKLNDEPIEELSEELPEKDKNIIDFIFTQSISSTLSHFTFCISGRRFGEITENRVKIDGIHVSDADGALIQEIEVGAYPRNASEDNRYGLEFGDYNYDGFLDLTIRRFPGKSSNNRTNYYWLWDNTTQQFVYDWKLSEVVTKENLIDFTVNQSIHDKVPPLTFRLLGRRIEGWSRDVEDMVDNLDANIHIIQVIDEDGKIVQEFDRLNAMPPRYESSFGLHFADYNFDGYLDMSLFISQGGSMRNEPHKYWLWDNSSKQFVENEELSEISEYSTISIITEENQLECYTRISAGAGITNYYKYTGGKYIFIYSIEWGLESVSEDKYVRYEIIKELIDDEIVITKNYYDDLE